MSLIAVTMLSYNTSALVRMALEALLQTQLDPADRLEVVVVDNGSHDDSAEMIARDFPAVKLIRNHENKGFAAGQNQAIQETSGEFVLVLNSDVLVTPDSIPTLVDFLRSCPKTVACVGPKVVDPKVGFATSARRLKHSLPMILLSELNRIVGLPGWSSLAQAMRKLPGSSRIHDNFQEESDRPTEAGYVDGMAAMFRREALNDVGLFDEQFFFDCEIVDLGIRLRSAGWSQWHVPSAVVEHVGGASRTTNPAVATFTNESKLRFYAKHHPQVFPIVRAWDLALLTLKLIAPFLGTAPNIGRAGYRQMRAQASRANRNTASQISRLP